ncbi:MAG: sulfotransferase family 2 domain-containing protein [Rhodobacteraceae bacterium]|nr:sulfotransferase family 2 domain-containing protein [Paracoccaceae bacterium]
MDFSYRVRLASRRVRAFATQTRYGRIEGSPIFAQIPDFAKRATATRMFVCPKHNFLFVRIPKCANSTLVKTFSKHCGVVLTNDTSGQKAKMLFNLDPGASAFEFARKVVFFREPLSRAVSMWLDKGRNIAWIKKRRFSGSDTQAPTFLEFLRSLEENEFHHNGHFIQQASMAPGDLSQYHIGTVENIDRDLPRICEDIFGEFLGVELRRSDRTNAHERLGEISQEERDLVSKLYHKDFVLYNSLNVSGASL